MPCQRREAVEKMQATGLSERRACVLAGQHRSTQRYAGHPRDDTLVRECLRRLVRRWPRFGLPRLSFLVREELGPVNHKRVHRVYCQEQLQLPRRRKKRRCGGGRLGPSEGARRPTQVWSMDFVSDTLASGRRFRALVVVDAFTRECLAIEADTSLSGERVVRVLRQLTQTRGLPERIVMDNGPEFTSRAMWHWSRDTEVALAFIQPGKPMQNGHCESFNGKLRDECLSQNYFTTLADARQTIEHWRCEYNHLRPHSSIGYKTPKAFRLEWNKQQQVQKPDGKLSLSLVQTTG